MSRNSYPETVKAKARELMVSHSPEEVKEMDIDGYRIPRRTLYEWKKKEQIIKEQIPIVEIIRHTQTASDTIDEAIDIARSVLKFAVTANEHIKLARVVGQLALWKAQITGEIAPIKTENLNYNMTAKDVMQTILGNKMEGDKDTSK
jgi:hypothetical protein